MLTTTGRKEKLSVSKGSYIEVSSDRETTGGNVWYHALLQEDLASSKRKKLSVLHLNPLSNEVYSPPLITTTFHRLIRPLPPPDPSPEVGFEEGDMIDAAHKGGWWSGWVVKVLDHHCFLVYLKFEPDVIEVERKDMRPHLVWKDQEWFRCKKRVMTESEFRAGTEVEVRIKVEPFGDIWAPGITIKESEDRTILVKYKSLNACRKINVPYSKIRPSPPSFGFKGFGLMENVDVLLESGWCASVVSMVLSEDRYTVMLGRSKMSEDFEQSQLRPSMEWKNGVWQKVSDREENLHAAEETTRIRVKVRATRDTSVKNLAIGKESVTENVAQLPQTPVSSGDLTCKMANVVISENTLVVTKEPEIAESKCFLFFYRSLTSQNMMLNESKLFTCLSAKEFHSPIVLGLAAPSLRKPPRKKRQARKNQKGNANDSSLGEKKIVNKKKRGRPSKFISTKTKQKTVVIAGNGSMTPTTETADMSDDDQPLTSWINGGNLSYLNSWQSSATPDTVLNAIVEKHVDVVETPKAKDSTMVLPFVKKSPCWKVLESMDIFKAVPQRPHFSPLLECEEESREGDAIGAMVKFSGLLEKVSGTQVDDSVTEINRIKECFLKLEKHGFDVTAPCSRIDKLLSIKESQTWALEELKVAEREITERDNKRRKLEEDIEQLPKKIVELQRQLALLKEEKVTKDIEIALMQSHAEILDRKVQNVEQEFQVTVSAPW
ncbi:unnamed protein product [Eruca vesicaria subsp. sativa]|uniref:Agenet domain-containing protein n=1 Tax=Eruca vesicaria subsp. sativa TaxID=29727 RepID=A0ABC8J9T9_ERUVS|nr:unnamed protein product [Eruca vesicaria subsp. sativa]